MTRRQQQHREEETRFRQALDAAFDRFLVEKVAELDRLHPQLRDVIMNDLRVTVEFGFCEGVIYEMERRKEEK